RHQAEAVVLAFIAQGLAELPATPDRAQGLDVLSQPGYWRTPRHAEAPLVVPLHLRAKAEAQAPARVQLQIPREVRNHHRAAREGHSDRGGELDALGGERREGEGDEKIVGDLRGREAVKAGLLRGLG